MMFTYKLKRVFQFLSLLRVEPFLFLFMFFYSIKKVPMDQLIQDKICLQKYGLHSSYCSILPQMRPEDDTEHKKSLILKDTTVLTFYMSILITLPSAIASLFIGSWTDRYINGKKFLMIAAAIAGICESLIITGNAYFYDSSVYWTLLSYFPSFLSGGLIGSFTAIWAYISSTTPPKMRAIRMVLAELCIFTAQPLGTYVGGQILNTKSLFNKGQLHNYTTVFIVGGIAHVIALFWTIFMVNEEKDILQFRLKFNRNTDIELNDVSKTEQTVNKPKDVQNNDINTHPLRLLFDLENVKDMFKTCLKKRDNYVRLQIWLLFLSTVLYLLSHIGPMYFLYQFAQKVYYWNSKTYSSISALGNLANALATLFIAPILIKVLKMKDTTLSLVGLTAYFGQNMIRALVLSETGFYISIFVGALGSVTSVGIRTHFSKIVENKELGKVFSLMSAIDSLVPLLASSIFTPVFNATMDTMPGLSFLITGGALIIPFVIMLWIDLYTKIPTFHNKKHNNESNEKVLTIKTKM